MYAAVICQYEEVSTEIKEKARIACFVYYYAYWFGKLIKQAASNIKRARIFF